MWKVKTILLLLLIPAALLSQAGSPFAVLSSIAPVAGVSGVQLSYDTTNKVVWVQTLAPGTTTPNNVLSLNPHVMDNGGSFSITVTIISGTPVSVLLSTATVGTSDTLVYRLSNGNPSQDKLCSNATPLPAGTVACSVIPF